eukprot:scaffold141647_cov87-Cyclotella_meneghiniana.AAC.1
MAPPRKKSKTHQTNISDAFFGSNEKQKKECMFRHYKGKRILLKATDIYGKNKVPKGEEAYNFQYIVTDVSDETYATIEFEGKYIKDDTEEFKSYPAIEEDDFVIDNYRLSCLKDDHALFNKYRGVVNKKINDAAQAQRDSEAAEKQSSLDDCSDIQNKIMLLCWRICCIMYTLIQNGLLRSTCGAAKQKRGKLRQQMSHSSVLTLRGFLRL